MLSSSLFPSISRAGFAKALVKNRRENGRKGEKRERGKKGEKEKNGREGKRGEEGRKGRRRDYFK
jgi:hypothetical protein